MSTGNGNPDHGLTKAEIDAIVAEIVDAPDDSAELHAPTTAKPLADREESE